VLIVDDSAFMRRLTSQIIEDSGDFVVAGTARDGQDALEQIRVLDPDVVTLDIDMPELDGLSALGLIMRDMPRPVVMLSAATTASAQAATLRALELGAVDFVLKPSGSISLDLRQISDRLLGALRAAAAANPAGLRSLAGRPGLATQTPPTTTDFAAGATRAVVIAASTGGPRALAAIVPRLSPALDAAVLVVQHMPPGFTRSFAHRLNGMSALRIEEAEAGEPVRHGRVYVAPGGFHMTVTDACAREPGDRRRAPGPVIELDSSPPVWGVRPAADRLFHSAAAVFGASTVAVVLTGMGRDGADGMRSIREAGGRALVQDRDTAAIFGMPHAALLHAGADRVVPLDDMSSAIGEMLDTVPHAS
jgi:two-component system chemotaxis response regulator CheB